MPMPNKKFDAYQLIDKNDKVEGTVWWDGEHLRASAPAFLKMIKHKVIPFGIEGRAILQASDGEDFFYSLPLAFRNGMVYLKSLTVDENGQEV